MLPTTCPYCGTGCGFNIVVKGSGKELTSIMRYLCGLLTRQKFRKFLAPCI
ncbi:MAG: hypothetical protein ACYDEF_07180 [Methanosarcina sp.]